MFYETLEDYIYQILCWYGDTICCATLALTLKRNNVEKIKNIQDIKFKVKNLKSEKDLDIYNIIFKQSLEELLTEDDVSIDILNKFLSCSENELIEYALNENLLTDDARDDMFGYLNLNELCIQLLNVENYKKVLCIDDISGIIQSKLFNKYNINIDTYENTDCEEFEHIKEQIMDYKKIRKYIIPKNSNILNTNLFTENFESKYDFAIASSYSLKENLENFQEDNAKKSLNEIFNRLKISNIEKRISIDYIVALKMLDALDDNGRGIMIFHSTALSNISEREIRKEFIEGNYIEGIIKIRCTSTSYSLVIFNKNKKDKNIKIYDAQQDCQYIDKSYEFNIDNILKKYNGNSTIVRLEKIIENNYSLNTNLYLEIPNFDEEVKLKEVIADLFRGYQITKQQLEDMKVGNISEANYKLLEIGCINDEGEIFSDLTMINSKGKKLDRYLLKDGDIVLTARGDKIKVAYIEIKTNERIIANGSINVIRVDKERINPKYLKIFFESEIGKRTLENIKIGYTTPSLNTGDLKNITIPCPSNLYSQNELAKEYDKIKDKIKNCKQDLYEITNKSF